MKYLIQLSIVNYFLWQLTNAENEKEWYDKYKIGIILYESSDPKMFGYIIWDILIALAVLIHKHFLAFLGVWERRENEIETLEEATIRINEFKEAEK